MTDAGANGASGGDGEGAGGRARAEMDDAPPFLTWRAIYIVVLGALAAEIVLALALAS
jgi:hypothetical protein